MAGDAEILRSVLYEIESSVPVMIVDQIDIRPVRGKRNRKTRKIEPSSKLNINFQATGFMRAESL
jgi:general secretion pathway protein M